MCLNITIIYLKTILIIILKNIIINKNINRAILATRVKTEMTSLKSGPKFIPKAMPGFSTSVMLRIFPSRGDWNTSTL